MPIDYNLISNLGLAEAQGEQQGMQLSGLRMQLEGSRRDIARQNAIRQGFAKIIGPNPHATSEDILSGLGPLMEPKEWIGEKQKSEQISAMAGMKGMFHTLDANGNLVQIYPNAPTINGKPPVKDLGVKPTTKNAQPYVTPDGKTVLINTSDINDAQKQIDEKRLVPAGTRQAELRAQAFGNMPVNDAPGAYYDKIRKGYFIKEEGQNGEVKERQVLSPELQQRKLAFAGDKKIILTANSPTFKRVVKNGEILAEGVIDPQTGKKSESEFDTIKRLRNEMPDGVFGSISNKLRTFNNWDQLIAYQFSDPNMARLKGSLIANIERLGSVYAGGGTVTSDAKMNLAREFLDQSLSKEAFGSLIDMHKTSVIKTVNKYKEDTGVNNSGGKDGPKTVVKIQKNKVTGQTRTVYSDGSIEVH